MKNCPDCLTDEYAVGEGVRCAAHEIAYLRSTLAAKDAELARLRGVVEAAARSFRLIAAQAKLRETWGISLDNIEIEAAYQERQAHLTALASPAEAGEKPMPVWSECGGCSYCPPAASSGAKAGERPCRCGRPDYPGIIHRTEAGCIADLTWKR